MLEYLYMYFYIDLFSLFSKCLYIELFRCLIEIRKHRFINVLYVKSFKCEKKVMYFDLNVIINSKKSKDYMCMALINRQF